MIPENVKKFFNENLWYIATCGDECSVPNVVPVGFKRVCSDGKLAVGAVLLETTLENIKANGKVAVACANSMTGEAYQIKGTAELMYEGEAYEHYCKLTKDTFKGTMELKCAIIITPEKLINASPNEHNKEEYPYNGGTYNGRKGTDTRSYEKGRRAAERRQDRRADRS